MEILIAGTGALATLFAARIGQVGTRVRMLGTWAEAIGTLNRDGARLEKGDGAELRAGVQASTDPRDFPETRLALVLVKAWQTERAARHLLECLAPDGVAVTLQNGLGNRETLARTLGPERVALGSTTTGATLLVPGLARAGGEGTISIEHHPALGPLEASLRSAGFDVRIVDDAQSLVWGKLVINAAINPLTALLRVPNGELLQRPPARQMLGALASETARVARAEGIALPFEDATAAAEEVAARTAQNRSSMLQDVERGAPTEIDAICGAVARTGQQRGVPTPANWTCWKLVSALHGPVRQPSARSP